VKTNKGEAFIESN